jgi:tetratricopeptide (TPR) repeat protein
LVGATDILSLIERHKSLRVNDVKELDTILNKSPWFSTLYMLQAKAHKNNQSTLFDGLLRKAAIYSGDRNVLYDFINNQFEQKQNPSSISDSIEIEQKKSVSSEIIEAAADALPSIVASKEIVTPSEKIETKEEVIVEALETKSEVLEINVPIIDEPVLNEVNLEKTDESIIPKEEIASLNEESDLDEPAIDLNKELKSRIKVIYNPAVELAKLTLTKEKVEVKPENIPVIIAYNPEKELAKYMEPKEVKEANNDHDFTFWLDHFNEEDEGVKNSKTAAPISNFDHSDGDPMALLEQFIQNRPSISRPKAEFFNAENMARKSEELKFDFVSESLAKLFLKQGLPEKALEIYEKLMLQNPSNNTFFAAQIEKIKNLK